MKRATPSRWVVLVATAALAGALGACNNAESGQRTSHGNSDSSGGGGDTSTDTSGATGGSTGTDGTTTGGTTGPTTLECSQPDLGSPTLRLLTRNELEQTLNAVFPQVKGQWSSSLPAPAITDIAFDNSSSNVIGDIGPLFDTALSVATAVTGSALTTILPCASSSPGRTCAETFVNQYGKRLFRRPLTQVEHDDYMQFYDSAVAAPTSADFKTALKWMAVGLIQSPSTVYRREIGEDNGDGTRSLTPYELATELSYTYGGTTPSDDLLSMADAGNLGDPVALAKALLGTDQGKAVLQHFFEDYLGYTQVGAVSKTNISTFDSVRDDMVSETRAFLDNVIFQQNGGLADLLTSPATNPSAALASYYGFPAPASDYAPITRPSGRGIGLLAQGSVLASRARPDGSSPTKRGLLVLRGLLCGPKLEVPPGVIPMITQQQLSGPMTTRQRYEILHVGQAGGPDAGASLQPSVCANCHKNFDPIGFGFEHYDEGGRYRDTENGLPIDSASSVPDPSGGSPLFEFTDEETLAQGLSNLDLVYKCFAQYLATYAFGTGQSCLGMSKVQDFRSGAISIADYFAGLAAEPHFAKRANPQ